MTSTGTCPPPTSVQRPAITRRVPRRRATRPTTPSRAAGAVLKAAARVAQDTPEVVECRRITGDDCYVMLAHVRDVEHLEEVIDRFTGHGHTTTTIVQSSAVPPRGVQVSRRAAP